MRQDAEVCRTLNIIVAAEDIGTTALFAHVAQCQLHNAVGAGVVVAGGVLGDRKSVV